MESRWAISSAWKRKSLANPIKKFRVLIERTMRRINPAEEKKIRQDVTRDAAALMQRIALEAYVRGDYDRPAGAGMAAFGIERAVLDYIERSQGRGRMAILAEIVAIRERKLSTPPPNRLTRTEPIIEDILIE
jgi:hypothetical protein